MTTVLEKTGSSGCAERRVAVVVGSFPVFSETFVVDHVVGLARKGWSPIVVCRSVDERALEQIRRDHGAAFDVEVLPNGKDPRSVLELLPDALRGLFTAPRVATRRAGLGILRHAAQLRATFRRLRPSVVHAHFADNGVSAALAAGPARRVIVDFHGWDFLVFPSRLGWQVIRQALRRSTLVAHSDFAERRIREATGLDLNRVRLGVNLDRFRPPPRSATWPSRQRWLLVGRLRGFKGQETAIRALAALSTGGGGLDAELTLVGDGPDRARLERLSAELRIAARVRFTGPLPYVAVAEEMRRADLLLVPSTRAPDGWEEAFGRVAIEGLASGLPVLVSDIGGLPEAVGSTGATVAPGDHLALAAAVRAIMDAATPVEWSRRSAARAREFSIERMWLEYDALTARVASRSP